MSFFKSLLVLWKDKHTNLYYHIGTLSYNGEKYVFQYTFHSDANRKVHDALRNGYRLHPAFPELKKKYESDSLFPSFDRRIPSNDRVDFARILKELGLPSNADRMDVLRETRGMLSGDAYSFEEPLRLYDDVRVETNFYVNGMRHQELPDNWPFYVSESGTLVPVVESENEQDPYAVRIETESGLKLGYIPGIHAQAVSAMLHNNIHMSLTVKHVRKSLAPQWWLRVELSGNLNINQLNVFKENDLGDLIQRIA